MPDIEVADALNEVRVLASVKHQNVCGFLEAFCESSELVVIIDFCERGDLSQRIDRAKRGRRLIEEGQIRAGSGASRAFTMCIAMASSTGT